MSIDSPIPRRRPPPRPPKSQYLLDKEAELRSGKQAIPCSSIAYPKGQNPFGESSDDEESVENYISSRRSPPPKNASPPKVGFNPFDDFVSDDNQDEIKPSESVIVSKVKKNSLSEEVHDGRPVHGEIDANKSIENITSSVKVEIQENKPSPPPPPNPFDGFSDEEEAEEKEMDNVPTSQIPPKPPRKRPAPKPPVFGSTDGLSGHHSTRLSLQAVNEASASPLPVQKSLSTSTESVQKPKGPAPSQPVGQKREIRAEGFVKYPKLRREIEEVNGKLLQIDEEITALNDKIEQGESLQAYFCGRSCVISYLS